MRTGTGGPVMSKRYVVLYTLLVDLGGWSVSPRGIRSSLFNFTYDSGVIGVHYVNNLGQFTSRTDDCKTYLKTIN